MKYGFTWEKWKKNKGLISSKLINGAPINNHLSATVMNYLIYSVLREKVENIYDEKLLDAVVSSINDSISAY